MPTRPALIPQPDETDAQPTVEFSPLGWWADARCADGNAGLAHLFFSEDLGDIARAKSICAACPVLADCLQAAMSRREPGGVWGGQLFVNGHILPGKRRRGRPPKQARPEDRLPDVPIPEHLRTRATHLARPA